MSYHFIGIGGIGMSALAHILCDLGETVSGSDIKPSDTLIKLEARGVCLFYSQKRGQVQKGQTVVYSTSISPMNEEFRDAIALGCPILHRSELLERLLSLKKALVTAGAHGKTTTTSLLTKVLIDEGMDPSYAIGGYAFERNGKWGSGEYFVAEGDESDGSFLKTAPYGSIVTNVDFDHLDFWKSEKSLLRAYQEFMKKTSGSGRLFFPSKDLYVSKMDVEGTSFGFDSSAEIRAVNVELSQEGSIFDIVYEGKVYEKVELKIPGQYNVLNALGVFGLASSIGMSERAIRNAFKGFKGVKRRMEHKGSIDAIDLFDDYAHHPRELEAMIGHLNALPSERRIVFVFQPHRYSRTKDFLESFVQVLKKVDHLIVTDIYSAGESPSIGVDTTAFCERLKLEKEFTYIKRDDLVPFLVDFTQRGDLIVTVGAGDITEVGPEFLREKGWNENL